MKIETKFNIGDTVKQMRYKDDLDKEYIIEEIKIDFLGLSYILEGKSSLFNEFELILVCRQKDG